MGFCRLNGTALLLRLVRREHRHEDTGPAMHARAAEIVLFVIVLSWVSASAQVMVIMDAPCPVAKAARAASASTGKSSRMLKSVGETSHIASTPRLEYPSITFNNEASLGLIGRSPKDGAGLRSDASGSPLSLPSAEAPLMLPQSR